MTSVMCIMLLTAVFGGALWELYLKEEIKKPIGAKKSGGAAVAAVLLIGFAVSVLAAGMYYGHKSDMGCFVGWSQRIYQSGFSQFYREGFHDYPPGYVYVMWVLGALRDLLNLNETDVGLQILIKMPAIIANIVLGYMVYRFAVKRFSRNVSAVFAALMIFNPTVILNSSLWGQIDSILMLFCLLTVCFSASKRFIPAVASFAVGVLIKPQAFFVFPVLAFALVEDIWLENGFDVKKMIKHFLTGLCGVLVMFILFISFGDGSILAENGGNGVIRFIKFAFDGISIIIKQYMDTLGQYNYMSVNAFNLYSALGRNWAETTVLSTTAGYIAMALTAVYAAYVFFKSKSPAKHYICAALIFIGVYVFGVKQHERYIFPGIAMLLYVLMISPSRKSFWAYMAITISQCINSAWILFGYVNTMEYVRSTFVVAMSALNVLLTIIFIYMIQSDYVNCSETEPKRIKRQTAAVSGRKKTGSEKGKLELSEKPSRLNKFDIIFIVSVMAVYSAVALYNLGNKYAPQTETVVTTDGIVVDFGETKAISKTEFYLGARHLYDSRSLDFEFIDGSGQTVEKVSKTSGDVFDWTIEDTDVKAKAVKVSTNYVTSESDYSDCIYLRELCFLDKDGEQIQPVNTKDEAVASLFDEQYMMAKGKEYMSGTIFDEIYHARTAYEFVHDMSVYEWTHPPLGKIFISLGILIFGMVPFGWRIAGTVFGILMVPVIYVMAKRMLRRSMFAAVVCLIFTFDFMHFAQTRIATIDTYVTIFIMLMYYYMYKYSRMSFYDTPLKRTLIPLGLSGVFFGLAVASKWTGLYAGAGLAIIFFYTLYKRYSEYKTVLYAGKGNYEGIEYSHVRNVFGKNTAVTLGFCVLMFVVVPVVIYTLSYIPFWSTPSGNGIGTAFKEIERMWTYHSKTVADSTHPFSSHWYEWPVMYRPIYYFSNTMENGLVQGISSFGNPAVWWVGIPAFAYMLALAVIIPLKKREYLGKSKWFFGEVVTLVFAFLTIFAYAGTNTEQKLERLGSCVLLYSCIIVAVFWLVLIYDKSIKQKSNSKALFLIVAYMVQLAPWILVARTTYIYHYFPCVPFVALMIGYAIKTIYDNAKQKRTVAICTAVYAVAAVALFAMFYCVLSGMPVTAEYGKDMLKWFDSWVLLPV